DALPALGPRLEFDHHASVVEAAAATATAANLNLILGDVGIFGDDVRDLELMARHLVEADALDRFRADAEAPLVLAWEEALRHQPEQIPGTDEQPNRDRERDQVEAQAAAQREIVQPEPRVEQ